MRKFKFYKEVNDWFVDLPEWEGSKSELQMVCGADIMLEYMSECRNEVNVYISEKEFEGADMLEFNELALDNELDSGAYYTLKLYKGIELNLKIWLCSVTLFVFNNNYPKKIFIMPIHD